jgi:hypothetical protein
MADYKGDYEDLYAFLEQTQPGSGKSNTADGVTTNEKFLLYPNKSRTVSINKYTKKLEEHTQTLPKGFIRNLITNQGGTLAKFPNIRCNFQFNPQDIQHQIEARKDMYLPILQDPSQLNQPMAGNATFAFELIFDRTMEVNSNRSLSVNNDTGTMPDPSSSETVGVFHDLRVLYSIIGQGLSQELMEAQLAKLKADVKNYATINYKELNIQATATADGTSFAALNSDGSVHDSTKVDTTVDLNSQKTADFLTNISNDSTSGIKFMSDLNVGNSAFLIPQPCRVIFSPMFMVDGFVMNTNVWFTKFSAKMIPIQCKVHLQMQAIYIGFARSKTFITAQIDETKKQNDEEQTTYNNNLTTLRDLLKKVLSRITVAYNADARILSDGGIADATTEFSQSITSTKTHSNSENFGMIYQPFWMFATKDFWYNRPFYIVGGTSTIVDSKPVQSTTNDPYASYDPTVLLKFANPENKPCLTPYGAPGLTIELGNTVDDRAIVKKKVFEDMSSDNPIIDTKVYSYIYGPFDSDATARTFSETISADKMSNVPNGRVGEYNIGFAMRDKDDWDNWSKTPKNATLGAGAFDPIHNSQNIAANPITKVTSNGLGKNVTTRLNELIETLNYPSTDGFQARALYNINTAVTKENTEPKWDASKVSSNSANGYNAVPFDLYQKLPNSLLDLVEEVHHLSNKYFVVVTVIAVFYNVTSPGNQPGGSAIDKRISIVKGDDTRFKVTLAPDYDLSPL